MPYLSALEVCSRRGATQIHVYLYLYLYLYLYHQVHMTLATFSRLWVQRSDSDGYKNTVNSAAPEPLIGYEPNLHKHFTQYGFKGQGRRRFFTRRHTDWRFTINFRPVFWCHFGDCEQVIKKFCAYKRCLQGHVHQIFSAVGAWAIVKMVPFFISYIYM